MENLKILNKKETEKIIEMIEEEFGFSGELDYAFLLSVKNKVYIVNKDIGEIDISKLRINSLGLYLGEIIGNEIRLSIEGAQIIGEKASKNIIEVDFDQKISWLKGHDITYSDDPESKEDGFKILKEGKDILGCGRMKDGKILNYMPKTRRLNLTGEYFGEE